MSTSILSLPTAAMVITTGTNEDWIEALLFLIPDGSGNPDNYPQLDLRGIAFEMEVRHSMADHEFIISASTADGTLKIGTYPNYGWLLFDISVEIMKRQLATAYVGDIVASDANFTRRCITFDLNLVQGITR